MFRKICPNCNNVYVYQKEDGGNVNCPICDEDLSLVGAISDGAGKEDFNKTDDKDNEDNKDLDDFSAFSDVFNEMERIIEHRKREPKETLDSNEASESDLEAAIRRRRNNDPGIKYRQKQGESNINKPDGNTLEEHELFSSMVLQKGRLIGESGKEYLLENSVSRSGGEGVVFQCNGKPSFAIKVYYAEKMSDNELKRRNQLLELSQVPGAENYIVPILDKGQVGLDDGFDHYFEVMPFCEEGSLADCRGMTFDEIVVFIRQINEALLFIHETNNVARFLHMDIKPENIFRYNGKYVLGDFGIARPLSERGIDVTRMTHVRKIPGTDGYQAPESRASYGDYTFLTAKVDYYSFATTIATLFKGKFIFAGDDGGFNRKLHATCEENNHIDLPEKDGRNELTNIVDGLFQKDPEYRFGYDDVVKWLSDYSYEGIRRGEDELEVEFDFGKIGNTIKCKTKGDYFSALKENWEESKNHLYNGSMSGVISKNSQPALVQFLNELVEIKYAGPADDDPNDKSYKDFALFLMLQEMYHGWIKRNPKYKSSMIWMGSEWKRLSDLADEIISAEDLTDYCTLLHWGGISYWIKRNAQQDDAKYEIEMKDLEYVQKIECVAKDYPEIAAYWFGYVFSTKKNLKICGNEYDDLRELIYQSLDSPKMFYSADGLFEHMIDYQNNTRLLGFLCAGGGKADFWNRADEEGKERSGIQHFLECIDDETISKDLLADIVFRLFERMMVELTAPNSRYLSKIHDFYFEYGPFSYTKAVYDLVYEDVYSVVLSEHHKKNKIKKVRKNKGGASRRRVTKPHLKKKDKNENIIDIMNGALDNTLDGFGSLYAYNGYTMSNELEEARFSNAQSKTDKYIDEFEDSTTRRTETVPALKYQAIDRNEEIVDSDNDLGKTDLASSQDIKNATEILNRIKSFELFIYDDIADMSREYIELKEYVECLRNNLQNNPMLAEMGIYQGRTIFSNNLKGYFGYNFLDKAVPWAFKAKMEEER